jgi:hypothetical protein
MTLTHKQEIDRNFDFFQRNLGRFLEVHPGEFALLRHERVIDFFPRPGDAYRAGLSQFEDELFSIQEVRQEPIELGHLAFDPR